MKMDNNLIEKGTMITINNTDISTEDKSIIGTKSLATCVGILLYSEEKKKAIVSHVSRIEETKLNVVFYQILELIAEHLTETNLKYLLIEGYILVSSRIF